MKDILTKYPNVTIHNKPNFRWDGNNIVPNESLDYPLEYSIPINLNNSNLTLEGFLEKNKNYKIVLISNDFYPLDTESKVIRAFISESIYTPLDVKETKSETEWKEYVRKGSIELRPYVIGEELPNEVSISQADKDAGKPEEGDMIARNPKNHEDQWLVAKAYFDDNYELKQE
jgi:hypothetical protein